jgi:hypothetical protein
MWKKKEDKKEDKKEESLLKELCGDDAKLYNFLSNYLYLNPLAAISKKDLETIHTTEQEKEKIEKEGLTDRAATLGRRIENQKFLSERAEDIINTASKFYNEILVELGENVRREAREKERRGAEGEERRAEEQEKAGREARKKERRVMGRKEKRKAKKQDKREDLAAEKRKEARGEVRKEGEREETRMRELENAGREARKKERRGN